MQINLVIGVGRHAGKVIPVTRRRFLIGRHRQCQLRVTSAKVSGHHCALELRDDSAFVRDLSSTNGTFVNEERLTKEHTLTDGDRMQIGPLVMIVHLVPGAPTPTAPLPADDEQTPSDTAIARLLLKESDGDAVGLLGAEDDSKCDSTILQLPFQFSEASLQRKKKKGGSSKKSQ